jgi:hypothetical protein
MYGIDKNGIDRALLIESTGALISSSGGKYRAATEAGRVFAAANQTVVDTTQGMALTYTGLALCNPVGSGKNFAILGIGVIAEIQVPTDIVVLGIMTGSGIGAAASVIPGRNRLSGGPASVAYVDDAVIFTEAPVLEQVLKTFHTGTVVEGEQEGFYVDLNGSIIVTPGFHASPFASEVNVGTCQFSWLWEEYTP